ncbi:hypothetical protein PPSIR1_19449 [Plesiocystis pacifica SIR-1]|uniref:ASPIC/UnbV domain-containing protein n=1 Tax=Plesiocystis pacifica SIR-1 TaxID=391625 RepID=A6GAI9_9BACT|nr:CRTAC1 family protein [Plesiocystis pacifica]EDM77051.1 hypothetical protein PPSIR1_19449 [Plesiocystis pacifica SIR-1]
MRAAAVPLVIPLLLGACRGPSLSQDEGDEANTESSPDGEDTDSGTGEDEGFDPFVCADWGPEPPPVASALPPPSACPDAGCPMFTDITLEAGLATVQFAQTHPAQQNCMFPRPTSGGLLPFQDCEPQWFTGGVSVGDVDRDGFPDLFMTRLSAPDHLFLNQGDGTFVDVAEAVGLGACTFTNGTNFGDIDNDGDLDILVTGVGVGRHYLYVNLLSETGQLRFEEQGEARGFALSSDTLHSGESVTLGDYDRDGWLDVHVNEWLRIEQLPPEGDPDFDVHRARLLRNLGASDPGAFVDTTVAAGVDLDGLDEDGTFAFSSTFADFDGDGWQDLAIAVDFARSRMFWNVGPNAESPGFYDGSGAAKVNRESNAMGSTWGDLDLDGRLDWYVTSIAELDDECEPGEEPPCWAGSGNRLYRYIGNREFALGTDAAGIRDGAWAWGAAFFDADNDGDLDLTLANGWPGRDLNGGLYHADTPMRLWMNHTGSGLEMSEEGALRNVDDDRQGRSVVAFDYDRDGDLDLLVTNHAGTPALLRNDGGNENPWLRVALTGSGPTNRDARGAVVRVQVTPESPWQVKEVGAGSHFLGEGELIQHFGLGPGVESVHRVVVTWPASEQQQELNDVAAGQLLELQEP